MIGSKNYLSDTGNARQPDSLTVNQVIYIIARSCHVSQKKSQSRVFLTAVRLRNTDCRSEMSD